MADVWEPSLLQCKEQPELGRNTSVQQSLDRSKEALALPSDQLSDQSSDLGEPEPEFFDGDFDRPVVESPISSLEPLSPLQRGFNDALPTTGFSRMRAKAGGASMLDIPAYADALDAASLPSNTPREAFDRLGSPCGRQTFGGSAALLRQQYHGGAAPMQRLPTEFAEDLTQEGDLRMDVLLTTAQPPVLGPVCESLTAQQASTEVLSLDQPVAPLTTARTRTKPPSSGQASSAAELRLAAELGVDEASPSARTHNVEEGAHGDRRRRRAACW